MPAHPVRLVVSEDLRRSRLTVFFRLLLALPHLVWLALWTVVAVLALVVDWLWTLIAGHSPAVLHNFLARYLRYSTHVNAYLLLAANPFPGFAGAAGSYPVDVEIAEPAPQNRWKTLFRAILLLPAGVIGSVLAGGSVGLSNASGAGFTISTGLVLLLAVFAWWVAMFRARIPVGVSRALDYGLGYSAQLSAYLLLLTDRYPDADPAAHGIPVSDPAPPVHPVRLRIGEDDGCRSRATVFFRAFLAIPLIIWLYMFTLGAELAALLNWFATLFRGTPPRSLHKILVAYLRYQVHVSAYLGILAQPYPEFLGEAGTYPIDLEAGPPERQNRWKTFFRLLLAIPAVFVNATLGFGLSIVAVFGWFVAVFTARMPPGLRALGCFCLRFHAQTYAYLFLVTDRYPYFGPELELAPPAPIATTEA